MFNRKKKEKVTITAIEILETATEKKSGVGRAIVGGTMFGAAGAIVGAATAKQKAKTTFQVTYSDGTVNFLEFENGSAMYKIYMEQMRQIKEKELSNG